MQVFGKGERGGSILRHALLEHEVRVLELGGRDRGPREDRPQEEFFTYGLHDHYGIDFRSEMLSLHRYKLYRTRMALAEGKPLKWQLMAAMGQRDALVHGVVDAAIACGDDAPALARERLGPDNRALLLYVPAEEQPDAERAEMAEASA